jgi:hypothetical protein
VGAVREAIVSAGDAALLLLPQLDSPALSVCAIAFVVPRVGSRDRIGDEGALGRKMRSVAIAVACRARLNG